MGKTKAPVKPWSEIVEGEGSPLAREFQQAVERDVTCYEGMSGPLVASPDIPVINNAPAARQRQTATANPCPRCGSAAYVTSSPFPAFVANRNRIRYMKCAAEACAHTFKTSLA